MKKSFITSELVDYLFILSNYIALVNSFAVKMFITVLGAW